MVRNQVYFTDDQDRELKLMASMGYGTFSELVRKGVDVVIKSKKKFKESDLKLWRNFVGAIKGGPKIDGVKAIQSYYMDDVV